MAEFETGIPSVRQIQAFIKDGTEVELKLLTGESLVGNLKWQDQHCICLVPPGEESILIWRHAIAYMKPQQGSGGGGSRALQPLQ